MTALVVRLEHRNNNLSNVIDLAKERAKRNNKPIPLLVQEWDDYERDLQAIARDPQQTQCFPSETEKQST
jgi:hypothetical protein